MIASPRMNFDRAPGISRSGAWRASYGPTTMDAVPEDSQIVSESSHAEGARNASQSTSRNDPAAHVDHDGGLAPPHPGDIAGRPSRGDDASGSRSTPATCRGGCSTRRSASPASRARWPSGIPSGSPARTPPAARWTRSAACGWSPPTARRSPGVATRSSSTGSPARSRRGPRGRGPARHDLQRRRPSRPAGT